MDNQEMVVTNNTANVNVETAQAAPQQMPVQPTVPVQQVATASTAAPVAEEKEGFWKRHWKKVVAGGSALLATGASVFVAYKKGKANGIASVPMPQQDYGYQNSPLDPNVE